MLPPVTILCPDLGSNALGRCLLTAELLAPLTEVEIVGALLGPEVWAPAAHSPVPLFPRRLHRLDQLARGIPWLRSHTAGRLTLIHKPQPTSLGWFLAARGPLAPALLDIDDWDAGFTHQQARGAAARLRRLAWVARRGLNPRLVNSELGTRAAEALVPLLPHRLVSNRWLQRRFGGELLYHVRDPQQLDPARADPAPVRARLALDPARPWVGFVGTLREHKGVGDLIEALASFAPGPAAPGLALLGGADPASDHAQELLARARRALGPERLRACPPFPTDQLADHLAALDLIALPSRDVPGAWGQIPAKLFDAMAMAKPLVVSEVNDMAHVLGEGGLVVPPSDPPALASALRELLADPARAQALGAAARRRLEAEFSTAVGREVLRAAVARAWPG